MGKRKKFSKSTYRPESVERLDEVAYAHLLQSDDLRAQFSVQRALSSRCIPSYFQDRQLAKFADVSLYMRQPTNSRFRFVLLYPAFEISTPLDGLVQTRSDLDAERGLVARQIQKETDCLVEFSNRSERVDRFQAKLHVRTVLLVKTLLTNQNVCAAAEFDEKIKTIADLASASSGREFLAKKVAGFSDLAPLLFDGNELEHLLRHGSAFAIAYYYLCHGQKFMNSRGEFRKFIADLKAARMKAVFQIEGGEWQPVPVSIKIVATSEKSRSMRSVLRPGPCEPRLDKEEPKTEFVTIFGKSNRARAVFFKNARASKLVKGMDFSFNLRSTARFFRLVMDRGKQFSAVADHIASYALVQKPSAHVDGASKHVCSADSLAFRTGS